MNCANFRGRAQRSEFWWWVLLMTMIWVIFLVFAQVFSSPIPVERFDVSVATKLLFAGPPFAMLLSSPVTSRRLHDTGRSGWWQIAPVGLFFGSIVLMAVAGGTGNPNLMGRPFLILALLVLMLMIMFLWLIEKGTSGENRFGPDPLPSRNHVENRNENADHIKNYKGHEIIRSEGGVSVNGKKFANVLTAEKWITENS